MARAARGNSALLGVAIDEIISGASSIGHPFPVIQAVTAPTAPTTVAGASGAVTATRIHYVSYLTYSGETELSSGSTPLVVSAKHITVTVPTSADTEVWGRKLYFSDDAGTTKLALPGGTIYDNVTTSFDDNIASNDSSIDTAATPQTYSQSGANGGYLYMFPETIGIDPDYSQIASKELKGSLGQARGAPGNINIPVTFKKAFETGFAVPIMASLLGKPSTITRNADGTNLYVWSPNTTRDTPVSFSAHLYPGGMRPEQFPCIAINEIDCDVKAGAITELTPKGMGIHHSKLGIARWASTPNANYYPQGPMIKGIRTDAAALTGDLYVKVTTAPSAGTFVIKCKITSGASYGSNAITIHYDTTTKKQIQYGTQTSDWVELLDSTSGVNYGGDAWENRRPVSILFPGDVTQLALNDEFRFDAQNNALIPGAGTTPGTNDGTYTGFSPRTLIQPRFTSCHAYLFRGTTLVANPATYEPSLNFKWKLAYALKAIHNTGAEAASAQEFDRQDFAQFQIDFSRRFIDRYFQTAQETDLRLGIRMQLLGEYPVVQVGGTRSTSRLKVQVDALQMRVDKDANPIPGPNALEEAVSFVAEQTDDLSISPFTVTILDGPKNRWNFRT